MTLGTVWVLGFWPIPIWDPAHEAGLVMLWLNLDEEYFNGFRDVCHFDAYIYIYILYICIFVYTYLYSDTISLDISYTHIYIYCNIYIYDNRCHRLGIFCTTFSPPCQVPWQFIHRSIPLVDEFPAIAIMISWQFSNRRTDTKPLHLTRSPEPMIIYWDI